MPDREQCGLVATQHVQQARVVVPQERAVHAGAVEAQQSLRDRRRASRGQQAAAEAGARVSR